MCVNRYDRWYWRNQIQNQNVLSLSPEHSHNIIAIWYNFIIVKRMNDTIIPSDNLTNDMRTCRQTGRDTHTFLNHNFMFRGRPVQSPKRAQNEFAWVVWDPRSYYKCWFALVDQCRGFGKWFGLAVMTRDCDLASLLSVYVFVWSGLGDGKRSVSP